MNEQERVAYLRSMGYQVYYPRFVLPGAKPSPRYELPDGDEIEAAAASPAVADSSASPRQVPQSSSRNSELAKVREQFSEDSKQARPVRKPAKAPSVESRPTAEPATNLTSNESSAELRFSLQFYAINESLAVINESPHQVSGKQHKEVQELLSAILMALNVSLPANGLLAEQFNWPLAEGLDVMGDPRRAAGLALQGFVSQRQEQQRFQNLLVFTNQLPDLLTPDSMKNKESFGDLGEVEAGYQLTLSHSLSAMLAHPQLKREVWSHLQVLRNRLSAV